MIHVITSNGVPINSIYRNTDNFVVVDYFKHAEITAPCRNPHLFDVFNVYAQADTLNIVLEDLTDLKDFKINSNTYPLLSPSLENIADDIAAEWKAESEKDDTIEPIVVCACSYNWNRAAVSLLTRRMRAAGAPIEALNIYDVLRVGSTESLLKRLKMELDTEFIYPDEPVSFAYAIGRLWGM